MTDEHRQPLARRMQLLIRHQVSAPPFELKGVTLHVLPDTGKLFTQPQQEATAHLGIAQFEQQIMEMLETKVL